ncbi:hypothetical protein GYMLUDRAFT_62806 [Collybiopsis luxurians FD-317 M1]|uniref:F-box domain-containing protein n=1 Tax=Collybiopsis luxurians FD-317 M1 TaxID=944289 RepID=A0A0D0CJ73_9AGAR|nr:hypothetical protein GYMLUDRAFT_62806 [Collybiopsis luxurians FD-317 M1]
MFTENFHRQPTFICPTSFQDLSVFKELPDLLWIHVFEQLTRSRDRYHVVQTCRKFYLLGLRELYSQLSFRHMSQFLDNVSFWEDRKDDMVSAPRSISVHGSFLSLSGRELFLRSNLAAAEGGTRAFLQIPATFMQRLTIFPNIREMIFDGISLPFEFYQFLFLFPNLRELAVTNCTFPRCPAPTELRSSPPSRARTQSFLFEDLPVTSLRLLGNKWYINRSSAMFSAVGSLLTSQDDVDYYNFLHIALAKDLHTLHTNWNLQTATFFGALARGRLTRLDIPDLDGEFSPEFQNQTHIWTLPSQLHTLRLTTRTKSDWLRIPLLARHRERRTYTMNLSRLLKTCTKSGSLRSLAIEGYAYPFRHPRERVRMVGLESYEGPLEFLRSVWGVGVDLKRVKVVESDAQGGLFGVRSRTDTVWSMDHDHGHSVGAGMGASGQNGGSAGTLSWMKLARVFQEERGRNYAVLEKLDIKVLGPWEDGVMDGIVRIFGGLRDLRIEVVGGGAIIEELVLNSLAHRYLVRLPSLETFHLYSNRTPGQNMLSPLRASLLAKTSFPSTSPSTPISSSGTSTPASSSVFPSASSSSSSTSLSSRSQSPPYPILTGTGTRPGTYFTDRCISEFIAGWIRDFSGGTSSHHSRLMEIRLTRDSVWRRASCAPGDDEWCERVLDEYAFGPEAGLDGDWRGGGRGGVRGAGGGLGMNWDLGEGVEGVEGVDDEDVGVTDWIMTTNTAAHVGAVNLGPSADVHLDWDVGVDADVSLEVGLPDLVPDLVIFDTRAPVSALLEVPIVIVEVIGGGGYYMDGMLAGGGAEAGSVIRLGGVGGGGVVEDLYSPSQGHLELEWDNARWLARSELVRAGERSDRRGQLADGAGADVDVDNDNAVFVEDVD